MLDGVSTVLAGLLGVHIIAKFMFFALPYRRRRAALDKSYGFKPPATSTSDIVLLGYSYGGMVVTGALEYVADRVAHLVYLDAFKPENGQALRDMSGAPYKPPAIGPIAVRPPAMPKNRASARPRECRSKVCTTMARAAGNMMAPPRPWPSWFW